LAEPILSATDLRFGFPQRPDFMGPIDLAVQPGQRWGVIGPNGAGKSTLLRLMAGLLRPSRGRVCLDGRSIHSISHRERARRLGFMPQHMPRTLPTPARDIVLMGRYPHRELGIFESATDHEIAGRAMRVTQTEAFADRRLSTLSGGEAQRVHIAAAIAQEPAVLLLDEPAAALDLHHQLQIFSVVEELSRNEEMAFVVVTHDLNLALRYCTNILLLHEGRVIAQGPPDDVIRPAILESVYEVTLRECLLAEGRWVVPVARLNKAEEQ